VHFATSQRHFLRKCKNVHDYFHYDHCQSPPYKVLNLLQNVWFSYKLVTIRTRKNIYGICFTICYSECARFVAACHLCCRCSPPGNFLFYTFSVKNAAHSTSHNISFCFTTVSLFTAFAVSIKPRCVALRNYQSEQWSTCEQSSKHLIAAPRCGVSLIMH
jgi:hypothetical protein